jgi:hypothetical protein
LQPAPEPLRIGLLQEDGPVPAVVHAVATVCSGIRRAAKRFWICIGALKIPLYWNSPISHHSCQEAFPGDLTATLIRTLSRVHCASAERRPRPGFLLKTRAGRLVAETTSYDAKIKHDLPCQPASADCRPVLRVQCCLASEDEGDDPSG